MKCTKCQGELIWVREGHLYNKETFEEIKTEGIYKCLDCGEEHLIIKEEIIKSPFEMRRDELVKQALEMNEEDQEKLIAELWSVVGAATKDPEKYNIAFGLYCAVVEAINR